MNVAPAMSFLRFKSVGRSLTGIIVRNTREKH
jgi:hypothetical protein